MRKSNNLLEECECGFVNTLKYNRCPSCHKSLKKKKKPGNNYSRTQRIRRSRFICRF